MKKSFVCLAVAFGLILFSVSVGAEENLDQRIKDMEGKIKTLEERKAPSEILKFLEGLKLNGFVDTSYVYDDNAKSNTFSLDQFEVDIEKTISDRASLRADVNFNKGDEDDGLDFDEIMEQGYVTYSVPMGSGVDFTFGKFNAPIGFELLDAPDMFQFSHALVFDYGLPTNLTGLMSALNVGEMIDLSLYIVNGWDESNDNNKEKTVGGRVGFIPVEGINFGISGIYGPERDDNNGDNLAVIDLDATITTVENLIIGVELNYGKEDNTSEKTTGDDTKWFGGLLMAHYDFTDWMGLTLRYDYFDDKEGSRLGLVAGGNDAGKAVKMNAYTIASTFTIADGAGCLVEYRYDLADEDFFEDADGDFDDHNHTIAVEFTYSF